MHKLGVGNARYGFYSSTSVQLDEVLDIALIAKPPPFRDMKTSAIRDSLSFAGPSNWLYELSEYPPCRGQLGLTEANHRTSHGLDESI